MNEMKVKKMPFSLFIYFHSRHNGKIELLHEDVARVLRGLHCPWYQLRLLKIYPTTGSSPMDRPYSHWVKKISQTIKLQGLTEGYMVIIIISFHQTSTKYGVSSHSQ